MTLTLPVTLTSVALTCSLLSLLVVMPASGTPLDDYVTAPDGHYHYTLLTSFRVPNATLHVLNMTSQKWMDERVSDRSVWWHYLTIVQPDRIQRIDNCLLLVDVGHNNEQIPSLKNEETTLLYAMAVSMGVFTASVRQIPNQPIVFKTDPSQRYRTEDAAIAWTWKMFLENTSNPDVIMHLPMTKAVVRAMDTVTSYCQKVIHRKIEKFFITGASKRAWVTWLTAAVDKRVVGFLPVVMDLLNMYKSLHHHFRSLGNWTFAFKEYYAANITRDLDTSGFTQLAAAIDPLVYNNRYKNIPKCVITATGDEFFLLDDSHFYFNELEGPKYLRLVPDAEHTMIGHILNVFLSMRSFYAQVINGVPLPRLRWEMSQSKTGGKTRLWTDRRPSSALMYFATTVDDGRRDFRLFRWNPRTREQTFQPVLWLKRDAKRVSATQFEAEMDKPDSGWAAFFIQVTFDGVDGGVLELTTEVNVVPDTFPFQDCHGEQCRGSLV